MWNLILIFLSFIFTRNWLFSFLASWLSSSLFCCFCEMFTTCSFWKFLPGLSSLRLNFLPSLPLLTPDANFESYSGQFQFSEGWCHLRRNFVWLALKVHQVLNARTLGNSAGAHRLAESENLLVSAAVIRLAFQPPGHICLLVVPIRCPLLSFAFPTHVWL